MNWGSELTNWAFIPWATLASVQEFNKNLLAPVILPFVLLEHFWVGQCRWSGQYHTALSTGSSLEFSSIITFVFSHKCGGIFRSTTLPAFCNNPNVTTYLAELFVTFSSFSASTCLWFIPQSFLLGYLAAFPHSSKSGGPFLSELSSWPPFWDINLHAWGHWWHQWFCSYEPHFGFCLEDVQNINVFMRCMGQFLIQEVKCCRWKYLGT